jgi:hypothetical protein
MKFKCDTKCCIIGLTCEKNVGWVNISTTIQGNRFFLQQSFVDKLWSWHCFFITMIKKQDASQEKIIAFRAFTKR